MSAMSTAFAIMEEPTKAGRRDAPPHNPSMLRALAVRVEEHAKLIRGAADLLENHSGKWVTVNHLKTVDEGLTAIRNVVREVEMKVDSKKWHKVTIDPIVAQQLKLTPPATKPKAKPKK